MKLATQNRNFSKSMKYFNPNPTIEIRTQQILPVRSSFDEKIDLLRLPIYERKKNVKKSLYQPNSLNDKSKSCVRKVKVIESQKNVPTDKETTGHYRYKSHHGKKSFHSWFRKASCDIQQPKCKKSVIDVVVLEKQIQKDSIIPYERTNSMINLQNNKSSKSLAHQDSQSLLRKNSLFLLNFIKRKQNHKKDEQPHIGGIPNLASHMRIIQTPHRMTKYPSQRESKKKPEILMSAFSRMLNSMPIDPW